VEAVDDGHHPGAQERLIMELLVLVVAVIVGVGLFRFWRARTAH
jgi:hypothetical protein